MPTGLAGVMPIDKITSLLGSCPQVLFCIGHVNNPCMVMSIVLAQSRQQFNLGHIKPGLPCQWTCMWLVINPVNGLSVRNNTHVMDMGAIGDISPCVDY